MSMAQHFDLVIVGGGIIGAWALHHATQRYPHWQILLIDRYRMLQASVARGMRRARAAASSARRRARPRAPVATTGRMP